MTSQINVQTNRDRVVMCSVMGKIHHPTTPSAGAFRTSYEGKAFVLPGVGGITYNVKIGDSVYAMEGDHIEPGVSLKNDNESESGRLNTMSCIGNEAVVMTGDAKGAKGFVTGVHGGIEHVLVYFSKEDLYKMAPDDKVLIRAWGQGLAIKGFDDVRVMSIDPDLFEKLRINEKDGKTVMPVGRQGSRLSDGFQVLEPLPPIAATMIS